MTKTEGFADTAAEIQHFYGHGFPVDLLDFAVVIRADAVAEDERFARPHPQGFGDVMGVGPGQNGALLWNIIDKNLGMMVTSMV